MSGFTSQKSSSAADVENTPKDIAASHNVLTCNLRAANEIRQRAAW